MAPELSTYKVEFTKYAKDLANKERFLINCGKYLLLLEPESTDIVFRKSVKKGDKIEVEMKKRGQSGDIEEIESIYHGGNKVFPA